MTTQEKIEKISNKIERLYIISGESSVLLCASRYNIALGNINSQISDFGKEVVELQQQLKAEQEVYDPNWRPKPCEFYWFVSENSGIYQDKVIGSPAGDYRILTGNVYKTKAQAGKGKQAKLLMAEIRETYMSDWHVVQGWILEILTNKYSSSNFSHVFGDRIKQLKEYL